LLSFSSGCDRFSFLFFFHRFFLFPPRVGGPRPSFPPRTQWPERKKNSSCLLFSPLSCQRTSGVFVFLFFFFFFPPCALEPKYSSFFVPLWPSFFFSFSSITRGGRVVLVFFDVPLLLFPRSGFPFSSALPRTEKRYGILVCCEIGNSFSFFAPLSFFARCYFVIYLFLFPFPPLREGATATSLLFSIEAFFSFSLVATTETPFFGFQFLLLPFPPQGVGTFPGKTPLFFSPLPFPSPMHLRFFSPSAVNTSGLLSFPSPLRKAVQDLLFFFFFFPFKTKRDSFPFLFFLFGRRLGSAVSPLFFFSVVAAKRAPPFLSGGKSFIEESHLFPPLKFLSLFSFSPLGRVKTAFFQNDLTPPFFLPQRRNLFQVSKNFFFNPFSYATNGPPSWLSFLLATRKRASFSPLVFCGPWLSSPHPFSPWKKRLHHSFCLVFLLNSPPPPSFFWIRSPF